MVIQQAKPARWWFALVLSHALTVLALAGAPPSNDEVKSNVNVQVKASVSPTVVEGMPCIMKILVTNHTPKIQYPPKDTWFKLTKEERGRILGQNAMAADTGLLAVQQPTPSFFDRDNRRERRNKG